MMKFQCYVQNIEAKISVVKWHFMKCATYRMLSILGTGTLILIVTTLGP